VIGFLKGKVAARTGDGCFIDVGGVGYRVMCSTTTLTQLPTDGKECKVWTHTHVREDILALYGFATEAEQRMFELLIGVSGVGPKVALQICSAFDPDTLKRALVTDDIASISSVPGIGKKTAARIVLDLKSKLDLPDLQVVGAQPDQLAKARSALENLGYSHSEIRAAFQDSPPSGDDTVEDILKAALKVLA
jgi:holliday junction DNA helicase RuvA